VRTMHETEGKKLCSFGFGKEASILSTKEKELVFFSIKPKASTLVKTEHKMTQGSIKMLMLLLGFIIVSDKRMGPTIDSNLKTFQKAQLRCSDKR
jgi:hypothetical protein